MKRSILMVGAALAAVTMADTAAYAQDAGEAYVRAGVARTKLIDAGQVFSDGVLDPAADYETRDAYHVVIGGGYYVLDSLALDASISTPATTNNIPAGSLAGLPNLGDDEFTLLSLGASFHPLRGPIRPYVGGGIQVQVTTQERDGLAVGLNIPNAHGPYVNAGVNVALTPSLDLFVDARRAWYHTNATGRLPLDATFTTFANIVATAELDPLTVQIGLSARLGRRDAPASAEDILSRDTSRWFVRAGITNLTLADEVELNVAGAPLANAGLSTFEHLTASVQIGRFLTDNLAVNATLGLPPTIDIAGAGAIGPLPTLGSVTYGPTTLTLQYHPLRSGRWRPYVGIGAAYMIVFDTDDGAFGDLEVDNDLSFAYEAGVEVALSSSTGLFVDAKRALLRPETRGTFGGNTVVGQTRLDPWAFTAGFSFRF